MKTIFVHGGRISAIVAAAFALGACTASEPVNTGSERQLEQEEAPALFEYRDVGLRSIHIVVDRETGCQYVLYNGYKAGGITPRNDQTGNQICN